MINVNEHYDEEHRIGKIIRIIDYKTVIIDVGRSVVNVGDELSIYQPADIIKDLDGSILGKLYYEKDRIVVKQVDTHYSVCEKKGYITKESRGFSNISNALASIATSPLLDTYEVKHPLKVNSSDLEPFSTEIDPVIHLGDPVRKAE